MAEIVTEIGMEFSKEDIVTVAVAKIEAAIRKEIRANRVKVQELDNKIDKLRKEYNECGLGSAPKEMTAKVPKLKRAFKNIGLNMNVQIVSSVGNDNNFHTMKISTLDRNNMVVANFNLFSETVSFTPRQLAITKELDAVYEERTKAIDEGVEAKRKLNDIPAAERQMKAVVVEHELNKSKEGKVLVDMLTKQYTTTMKLIEM